MPTIRLRSQLGAASTRSLDAYVRHADKAVAVRLSDALLSETSAASEMAVLASIGRVRLPVWHFVISWPSTDSVDTATALDTGAGLMHALQLGDAQWIAAAHGDANHRHVHVLVNRVDPLTHKTRATQRVAPQISAFRAQVERQYGWSLTGAANETLPARARDAETWNGDISFMRWLRDQLADAAPTSWTQLDARLAALGVVREARRSGFVFVDHTGGRTFAVRASSVGFGTGVTRLWGLSPAPPGLATRERLSYAELLALGALRSPAIPTQLHALRERWTIERVSRPGTAAQFGKWLRRQVFNNKQTTNDSIKGLQKGMNEHVNDHSPTNLLKDGNTAGSHLAKPMPANTVHGAESGELQTEAVAQPEHLSADAIAALYKTLRDEHTKSLTACLSNDDVLAGRLRAYDAQRISLQDSARTHLRSALEAGAPDDRRKGAMGTAAVLGELARAQERTAIELAPHRANLQSLKLADFDQFIDGRPDLTDELRSQLRDVAQTDPQHERREIFVYDEALASLVNLRMDRVGDDLLYYNSPPAIALQPNKGSALQLLFCESADGFVLARTPSSQAVDAALVIAAARWGNCISLAGDDAFIEQSMRRAVELRIQVTNPELETRIEQIRAEGQAARRTQRDGPLWLPGWLPTSDRTTGGDAQSARSPQELRFDQLCMALRASAFGVGVREVVNTRTLADGHTDAAYATTLLTVDGPVVAGCDAQGRMLVTPLADAEATRNAALQYQALIDITTGAMPEVSIGHTPAQAPEQTRERAAQRREVAGGRSR